MKPLTGKELASEIHRLYAEIREKSKEIAKLKELLKEAEKWGCEKCAICDHIRCERYEWLTKQKLWSGSQKPSKR